jgi:cyanate permease
MTSPPLAHFGHWYQSLLYLAPVLIVLAVLWVQERRERKHDANAARDDPTLRGER